MIVMREVFKRDISTHTLTWSVTNLKGYDFMSKLISTHTLTWSVTELSAACMPIYEISTHTLTWSVTGYFLNFFSIFCIIFQLTRSRGA